MKKILLTSVTAFSLILSASAFADSTAVSNTNSNANAGAISGATGGNALGVGAQGQSQGVSITTIDNSETDPPAIAPNLGGMVATPTTCMGSVQASGAGAGIFAFGLGGTYRDIECEKREALKLAAQLGLKDAAAALFYNLDAVRDVMGSGSNPVVTAAATEATTLAKYDAVAAASRADTAEARRVNGRLLRPGYAPQCLNAKWANDNAYECF